MVASTVKEILLNKYNSLCLLTHDACCLGDTAYMSCSVMSSAIECRSRTSVVLPKRPGGANSRMYGPVPPGGGSPLDVNTGTNYNSTRDTP